MSVQYLVLIGDLRDSRAVKDRAGLQHLFDSSLASLNQCFKDALASPLTVTLGDQFQAVFSDPLPVWDILSALQARLFPVTVRFGLGLGEIATPVNPQAARGMDGPAFYRARNAIVHLKEEGGTYRIEGLDDADLINHTLSLVSGLQESWHCNRFATYHSFLSGVPVQQIAQELAISKAAVYKNLHDGHLYSILGIHRSIAARMAAAMELTADA